METAQCQKAGQASGKMGGGQEASETGCEGAKGTRAKGLQSAGARMGRINVHPTRSSELSFPGSRLGGRCGKQ